MMTQSTKKRWGVGLAIGLALSIIFFAGMTGLSAYGQEQGAPVVLADFNTGTAEEWFYWDDITQVNGATEFQGVKINEGVDTDGRKSFQIVPEDCDAADLTGATPGVSDNKVALIYTHSWGYRGVRIPFTKAYPVTENTVLSFRIKMHLPQQPEYPWSIWLTAFDSTNELNEGFLLNSLARDQWQTIVISSGYLKELTDAEGKLSGITVSNLFVTSEDGYTGGNGPTHIMLDDFQASEQPPQELPETESVLSEATYADLWISQPALTSVNGQYCPNDQSYPNLYDWYSDKQYYGVDMGTEGAKDGTVLRLNLCHWRGGGLKLNFKRFVPKSDIASLNLRMKFHISEQSPYADSIYLFAPDGDGAAGTGYTFDNSVTQDEWVDIRIEGEELDKLADQNGYISGLQFAYRMANATNYQNWAAYVLIDEISVSKPATVTLDDGASQKTESVLTMRTMQKPASPTQEGKVFAGWYQGTEVYDFDTLVTGDFTLTAKWLNRAADDEEVFGLYRGADGNLMLYPDGTAFLDGKLPEGTLCGLAEGGTVIFDTQDSTETASIDGETITWRGVTYTRTESVTITYLSAGESYVRYIVPGERAEELSVSREGYIFAGWFAENAESPFDFTSGVSQDQTLTAKWEFDKKEIDKWTYATYYADGETLILKQKADSKTDGEAFYRSGDATRSGSFVILTSGKLVVVLEDEATETTIEKYSLVWGGKTFRRLGKYLVTFDVKGGDAEIPAQTFAPSDGSDYRISKPADPVREGYIFKGWKTGDGSDFDFEAVVTESVTLYAQWESADSGEGEQGRGGCKSTVATAFVPAFLLAAASLAVIIVKKGGNK